MASFGSLPGDHIAISGLAFAFAVFAYSYLCGSVLRAPRLAPDWHPAALNSGAALLDVVIVTASGMSIIAFFTFLVGLAGLIYPVALVALLVALGGVAAALGDNPLTAPFWIRRATALRRAISPGALLVLAATVALAYSAIAPDPGSDATTYHHSYAFDWATAHRIYVDPWLRGPLYTNNLHLLVLWAFELNANAYVLFFNWLTGALAVLGVYGYVVSRVQCGDESKPTVRDAMLGIAAVAMLLVTPEFFVYWNLSYLDVPMGFFFIAFAASSMVAITRRVRYPIADIILTGGFLIGTKISFIALLPLLVVAAGISARAAGLPRRASVWAAMLAVAFSSPWYIRNFIIAGDPLSPILNIRLHGVDKFVSETDYINNAGSISVAKDLLEVLRVPVTMIWSPAAMEGAGASLVVLLLWSPALVVAYALVRGRQVTRFAPALAASFLLYAYAYWMLTSYFERYALLFVPFLCAFVASLLTLPGPRHRLIKWLAVIPLFALAIPTPAALSQWEQYKQTSYVNLRSFDGNRDAWLRSHTHGYRSIEYIAQAINDAHRTDLRVYALNLEIDTLFFKLKGVQPIGEWLGPQRYRDFVTALDQDDMRNYLARLHIGVIVIPPPEVGNVLNTDELEQIADEMHTLGYRHVVLPGDNFEMYFSPELGPLPPLPAAVTR